METMSFSAHKRYYRVGVLNRLGTEAAKYGKKAIIVTYPDIRRAEYSIK